MWPVHDCGHSCVLVAVEVAQDRLLTIAQYHNNKIVCSITFPQKPAAAPRFSSSIFYIRLNVIIKFICLPFAYRKIFSKSSNGWVCDVADNRRLVLCFDVALLLRHNYAALVPVAERFTAFFSL